MTELRKRPGSWNHFPSLQFFFFQQRRNKERKKKKKKHQTKRQTANGEGVKCLYIMDGVK